MNIDIMNSILKAFLIYICIYYSFVKITNYNINGFKQKSLAIIYSIGLTIVYVFILLSYNQIIANLICMPLYTLLLSNITKNKFAYSIVIMIIALGITLGLLIISTITSSIIANIFLNKLSKYSLFSFLIIACIQLVLIISLFKTKRFKNRIFICKK